MMPRHTSPSLLRRCARDNNGATLVEFAVVLALFLLIFFGLIDFGRLAFNYVTAEKAMQVASRVAAEIGRASCRERVCAIV